jgi:hypothetical protein
LIGGSRGAYRNIDEWDQPADLVSHQPEEMLYSRGVGGDEAF